MAKEDYDAIKRNSDAASTDYLAAATHLEAHATNGIDRMTAILRDNILPLLREVVSLTTDFEADLQAQAADLKAVERLVEKGAPHLVGLDTLFREPLRLRRAYRRLGSELGDLKEHANTAAILYEPHDVNRLREQKETGVDEAIQGMGNAKKAAASSAKGFKAADDALAAYLVERVFGSNPD